MGNTAVKQIAFRLNGSHLGRFAVAAVFLLSFFVSCAWATCTEASASTGSCYDNNISVRGCGVNFTGQCGPATYTGVYNSYCIRTGCRSDNACGTTGNYGRWVITYIECTTERERDSVECVRSGNVWQNGACQAPLDSSACEPYRQECVSMGGRFVGNPVDNSLSPTGCLSFCDLCSSESQQRYRRAIAKVCCGKGQVPPENVTSCVNNELAGTPEMSFSSFDCDNRGGFDCSCEEVSSENSSTYQQICIDDDWPESSSGGTPGSSSSEGEGGSSSGGESPYPEGCDECPWLDSILDTLTLNKWNTDDIVACLTTPGLCAGLVQEPDTFPVFAFDTAFNNYLKPLMDSALKVDSLQLKALLKLDTSILKQLKNDTLSMKNDTTTWHRIDALGNVIDGSITTANDTTRKWFKRIADSIGVSTDSLVAHIDSIVRHIPDSILDSIVKYQHYANDNFDSVLFGHGKGFSLVDSLIDSSVKYFKESNQKWNEYITMYGDSTQKIHEEIIDLPGRNASAIGAAFGYGDTATSNLRGDLNGIREAIEGLGDSIGGFGGGFDTAMYGGNYGARSVDTSYGSWINTMSNRYANLAKNAAGGDWGDSATLETVFATTPDDTAGNSPRGQDSAADAQYSYLTDSAETMLARAKDSLLKDTSLLRAYYDTLKTEMQIWNFDSILIGPIREAIPDNNTCPEDCFKGQFALPGAGDIAYDYGLCRRWPILVDQDIFMFIRIILRLLTAVACIYIGMWAIAGGKN